MKLLFNRKEVFPVGDENAVPIKPIEDQLESVLDSFPQPPHRHSPRLPASAALINGTSVGLNDIRPLAVALAKKSFGRPHHAHRITFNKGGEHM